jgi:hypothetical protein
MEELDGGGRALDDGVMHLPVGEDRAHGQGTVGDALGGGHDVRGDAQGLGPEGLAQPAEACDDLVEDQ